MEYYCLRSHLLLLPLLSICFLVSPNPISPSNTPTSPYLSPSLFFSNYQKMLQTFKIFIYDSQTPTTESLFHTSLLQSNFTTTNGNQAHLFYLHFPPNSSHKSISREIKHLQTTFPFWNRTLGADHFYVSCKGVAYVSDRNIVELKKNAIQLSCFPSIQSIPHKDITLPPPLLVNDFKPIHSFGNDTDLFPKFCMFSHGNISGIGQALRYGCVPVVITDRLIVDLPFSDVLRWSEIAVFVEKRRGVEEMKNMLKHICGDKYENIRELGMMASKHFVWNDNLSEQPFDGFHMVLYQLWMRRHVIRYARRDEM